MQWMHRSLLRDKSHPRFVVVSPARHGTHSMTLYQLSASAVIDDHTQTPRSRPLQMVKRAVFLSKLARHERPISREFMSS